MLHITREQAFTACACRHFAQALQGDYDSVDAAIAAAQTIWWTKVGVHSWLEAFAAHPKIGDAGALRAKFAGQAFGQHSQSEQAHALSTGGEEVFRQLAALNAQYEQRYGHIFIICADGRSAGEVLEAIKERMHNTPYEEVGIAAKEQMKITQLRLEKLLQEQQQQQPQRQQQQRSTEGRVAVRTGQLVSHLAAATAAGTGKAAPSTAGGGMGPAAGPSGVGHKPLRSPITTHVLDTALGCPAEGLCISLHRLLVNSGGGNDVAAGGACSSSGGGGVWERVAGGATDVDGRIGGLLPPGDYTPPGTYRMQFETGPYLARCGAKHPSALPQVPFYPRATIDFTVTHETAHQHFHIPLLLQPFGYGTYRGS